LKRFALIVAGGTGTRMGSALPKQFLLLAGKPVLMHTMQRFFDNDHSVEIVLVLPKNQIDYWKELCRQYSFTVNHKIVEGGSSRFYSVKNGLELVDEDSLVAVHDGVRPFVNHQLINSCFDQAAKNGNAIPAMPVHESLRKLNERNNERIDRTNYVLIQTPQCFQSSLLKNAYAKAISDNFTDDASVLEESGIKIHLVDGLKENIKITTKIDMYLAEGLINHFNH